MATKLFKTIINVVIKKLFETIIPLVTTKLFKTIIILVMTKLFTTSKAMNREDFGLGTIMVRLTIMTKTMTWTGKNTLLAVTNMLIDFLSQFYFVMPQLKCVSISICDNVTNQERGLLGDLITAPFDIAGCLSKCVSI